MWRVRGRRSGCRSGLGLLLLTTQAIGCSNDTAAADTDTGDTSDATTVATTITPTGGPGTQGSEGSSSDTGSTTGSESSTGGPPVGPSCREQPDADRTGTRRWEDAIGAAEVTIDDPDAQRLSLIHI